jgi:glucosylceramidase
VTINASTAAVTRNVAYYLVGHASRFVDPGSVRVASAVTGGSRITVLPNVAYRTPAGRHVVVAMNDGNRTQTFNISYRGRIVTHSLGVGSVATYVW